MPLKKHIGKTLCNHVLPRLAQQAEFESGSDTEPESEPDLGESDSGDDSAREKDRESEGVFFTSVPSTIRQHYAT